MAEPDHIQKERDRKIVEIVHNFLLAVLTFRHQYEKYSAGTLHFPDLAKFIDDRGRSILWMLKESCQSLFRQSTPVSAKEQIFDLTIGSIFHLAMKMREDLYQIDVYGPKYRELNGRSGKPPGEQFLAAQFKKIISRAESSFKEEMEEIATLSQDIFRQFKELLHEYRENGLLIRFLFEQRELVEKALGSEKLEDLWRDLYPQGEIQACQLAGESYFQSAFYTKAIKFFSRALEKQPGNEELQFKVHFSQGMEQFYAFAPQQALKSLEKCLSLAAKVGFLESYRTMVRKICLKIQEEFPGRKKGIQHHRDLITKAQALQRQLEELAPASSAS